MMIRCLVVIALLMLFGRTFAQIDRNYPYGKIHVKVIDAKTNEPIPFANVYISRSTIGGYTDENGEVTVSKIPIGTHELVISSLSHKSVQRKLIMRSDQTIHMTVQLLEQMLEAVEVRAKQDDKWHRQFARFERLFFGSRNFKECVILNPWVLDFHNSGDTFSAEASQPLKIQNNYLGYDLEFDLKACAFGATKFVISGLVRFEEKHSSDSLNSVWKNNRENVFRGSLQHFLRSVLDSSLTREAFEVYSDQTVHADIIRKPGFLQNVGPSIIPNPLSTQVNRTDDGLYTIDFPQRLEVHYLRKRAVINIYHNVNHQVSWMEVKDRRLVVNPNGMIQNHADLVAIGSMSDLRVAEWLPSDFEYTEKDNYQPVVEPAIQVSLLEKPYVQTDRSYYYNAESIWFKGYMSYTLPFLKDTLSQTVYVDLEDNAGNILATRRYRIEDGTFHGDILIDKTWKPGLYQLKAYTAWMLNFDQRLIFTKTIDLLGEKEAVRVVTNYNHSFDSLLNIAIVTDKPSYAPREKITVTINTTDSLGFPVMADLSMSVTDVDQVVPVKNEKSIVTNFLYGEQSADSIQIKYNIEYGIAFNGKFWLGKKPAQGVLTVFQDNSKDTWGIITDETGNFQRSLSFNDTLNFYIRAMSANNKKGRVVMDTLRPKAPSIGLEPTALDIYTSENARHVASLNFNSAKLLQEVTVKASKIEKAPSPAVIHGSGDYTITGDWMTARNYTDVFLALQAKVPGLRYDPSGPSVSMNTSQFASFNAANTSPLFVVDGIAITDIEMIRDIPIRSIVRVDVVKFSGASTYGARGAGGVITIFTDKKLREEQAAGFDKNKLQAVTWTGYSTPSTFNAPDYSHPLNNDYFDYRATIAWNPVIKVNGTEPTTVTFYAADAVTKYRIVVEGVTAKGTPVHAEAIIDITKER
jgi:hypothetical protein